MEADDAHLWRGHDAGCAPCAASVPRHSASRITTASIVEPVWRPVARATVTIVGPWRRAKRPLPATFLPTQARAMAPPLWASSPWLASAVPTTLSGYGDARVRSLGRGLVAPHRAMRLEMCVCVRACSFGPCR